MYIYEVGFRDFQMGYASTLALVIFLVIMVVHAHTARSGPLLGAL